MEFSFSLFLNSFHNLACDLLLKSLASFHQVERFFCRNLTQLCLLANLLSEGCLERSNALDFLFGSCLWESMTLSIPSMTGSISVRFEGSMTVNWSRSSALLPTCMIFLTSLGPEMCCHWTSSSVSPDPETKFLSFRPNLSMTAHSFVATALDLSLFCSGSHRITADITWNVLLLSLSENLSSHGMGASKEWYFYTASPICHLWT